jgi:hypothetical protein
MKTDIAKNIGHEIGYSILVTILLVVLSFLVFPLFIAFLPVAILVGGLMIWHRSIQEREQ